MKALVSALVVTAAFALSSVAAAEKQSNPSLRSAAHRVAAFQRATWGCQDRLNAPRTRASTSIWSLPKSVKYRKWAGNLWRTRANRCKQVLARRTIPFTNDWQTAVRIVQRVYPGTSSWMLYISHREGGYGPWVWYGGGHWHGHHIGGDTVGGNMQFRYSTFAPYWRHAQDDLKRRGYIIPTLHMPPEGGDPKYVGWLSPLAQALTAGYMRFTGQDRCHWCI